MEDLTKHEAFIYVPNKCIISTEHARKSSEIGHLFDSCDELFVTNQDRDICTLMVFIIYERLKGDESFYHPYFDMVDSPVPTCFWPDELIERSDLHEFKLCLKDSRINCDEEWSKM